MPSKQDSPRGRYRQDFDQPLLALWNSHLNDSAAAVEGHHHILVVWAEPTQLCAEDERELC